jgi:hypothetical protein
MDYRLPDVLEPRLVDLNQRHVPGDDLVLEPPGLADRYKAACEYGQLLWAELAETRRYLRDAIAGGDRADSSALDAGPVIAESQAWQQWAERYEHICSALAGRSGDAGFGRSEATLIARSHGVEIGEGIPRQE